jgi:hypothetical protein
MNDSIDRYLGYVRDKIATDGWAVQFVEGREMYIGQHHIIEPPIAYSVGLTARQQPELIVIGDLPPDMLAGVINCAIHNAEEFDEVYADGYVGEHVLQDYPVIFRAVADECAQRIALVSQRLYGNVRLLQMFLPDENGHFPWHTDCEDGFNEQAALQYISPPPGLH